MTFAEAEDRSEENQEQMSFSNVIIQRVGYEYTNNSKIMPVMQSVGKAMRTSSSAAATSPATGCVSPSKAPPSSWTKGQRDPAHPRQDLHCALPP